MKHRSRHIDKRTCLRRQPGGGAKQQVDLERRWSICRDSGDNSTWRAEVTRQPIWRCQVLLHLVESRKQLTPGFERLLATCGGRNAPFVTRKQAGAKLGLETSDPFHLAYDW